MHVFCIFCEIDACDLTRLDRPLKPNQQAARCGGEGRISPTSFTPQHGCLYVLSVMLRSSLLTLKALWIYARTDLDRSSKRFRMLED